MNVGANAEGVPPKSSRNIGFTRLGRTDHNNASGHRCTPVWRQKFVPFQLSHVLLVLSQFGNYSSKVVLSYHVNLTPSTMEMGVVDINLRI